MPFSPGTRYTVTPLRYEQSLERKHRATENRFPLEATHNSSQREFWKPYLTAPVLTYPPGTGGACSGGNNKSFFFFCIKRNLYSSFPFILATYFSISCFSFSSEDKGSSGKTEDTSGRNLEPYLKDFIFVAGSSCSRMNEIHL